MLTNVVIALVPVVAFLAALAMMDSFRLVRPSSIAVAMTFGACSAVVAFWLHGWLLQMHAVPAIVVSRYIAPLTEETAKALLLGALVVTARIGFPVEAAIQGFAVGTGFALVENLTYLRAMPDAPVGLWFVRGLGTAVLQGGTTAIFAMIAKTFTDRHPDRMALGLLPGWAAAVAIHSAFNHRLLPPMAQALAVLIALPLLVRWVFTRSENATREWIGAGMDLDVVLLDLVASEHFAVTRFGRYLVELRARMPGAVVADMFCLVRLDLELSVQAKAYLLAREAGIDVAPDEDLAASLAERDYLKQSIGKMGLLALKPLEVTSHRDQWHRHLLQQRGRGPV
jgi:RsiW-degrading membrane proteinase PrsW (M82 family)